MPGWFIALIYLWAGVAAMVLWRFVSAYEKRTEVIRNELRRVWDELLTQRKS